MMFPMFSVLSFLRCVLASLECALLINKLDNGFDIESHTKTGPGTGKTELVKMEVDVEHDEG